jgi:serine/threonine protein kinase
MTRPSTPNKSSSDELYSIVSQVGEGTFGKVYKAQNTVSGLYVALKRIRMESERDGFPVTAMREIKLLQSLRHDNIVRLYEMMVSNGMFSIAIRAYKFCSLTQVPYTWFSSTWTMILPGSFPNLNSPFPMPI